MPNWVYAGFNVTGDAAELSRFAGTMFKTVTHDEEAQARGHPETEVVLDFNGIIPMPPEAERGSSEGWAVDNWGVKWNALDLDMRAEPDKVWFQFTTPWDFPTPVFEALAAEFPKLVFAGSAYEENHEWELVGEFNGDDDWGPGEIQWIVNTALGIGDDDDDDTVERRRRAVLTVRSDGHRNRHDACRLTIDRANATTSNASAAVITRSSASVSIASLTAVSARSARITTRRSASQMLDCLGAGMPPAPASHRLIPSRQVTTSPRRSELTRNSYPSASPAMDSAKSRSATGSSPTRTGHR